VPAGANTVFTAASAASVIGQQVTVTRFMTLEVLGTGFVTDAEIEQDGRMLMLTVDLDKDYDAIKAASHPHGLAIGIEIGLTTRLRAAREETCQTRPRSAASATTTGSSSAGSLTLVLARQDARGRAVAL